MGISTRGHRILIVDDYQPFLEGLREWLCMAGYQVETATNPLQALAKVMETRFDAAVIDLDFSFPKPAWLTGSAFIQRLRTLDPALHLILFAAEEEETSQAFRNQVGDAMIFPKPVQPATLKEAIGHLVAKDSPEKTFCE